MSINDILELVRIRKKYIFKSIAFCFFINIIFLFILDKKYVSQVTLLPSKVSSTSLPSSLANLGGIIDLDLDSGGSSFSPDIYPTIIQSKDLAQKILFSDFNYKGKNIPLFKILTKNQSFSDDLDMEKEIEKQNKRFREELLNVSYSNFTDIIKVTYSSNDSQLSYDVLTEIINQIEKINNSIFNQKKIEKVLFLEKRIIEINNDLIDNEKKLIDFMEENSTNYQKLSPTISSQLKRLERNVDLKSQVLIGLNQQLEVAKIDLEDSSSILHIIDSPSKPLKPSFPNPILFSLLSIIIGFIIGLFFKELPFYRR